MRRDCVHKSCDLNIHVKLQKTSETAKSLLREINPNFKEVAIFPIRIKGIDSRKFSKIANAISEPKIGQLLRSDVFVSTDGQTSPESFDVTK